MSLHPSAPDPVDAGPQALLTRPSYAAQTALVTARLLEMNPAAPMTGIAREDAIHYAADAVCRTLPDAVCRDSLRRLYEVLPPLTDVTCGEYAIHLRTAARGL